MVLKFYTSVTEGLKISGRKFLDDNSYVCRSERGKIGIGAYLTPFLNRVKHKQEREVVPQHLLIHSLSRNAL